jgi:hypothetical protein
METGVDETASNACMKGRFYCESKYALNKYISSYKVNDGYCDCCACEDEYLFQNATPEICFSEFHRIIDQSIGEISTVIS